MPLNQTSGNVTTDAYGGGVAAVPNYIEDVFSTYLYTGNGSTQTITNGIDLSTKGGMVWIKDRSSNPNYLSDTTSGINKFLVSNSTASQYNVSGYGITAFNSNGFTAKDDSSQSLGFTYPFGDNFASWTFRKQPKFFDVVTYTGTGSTQSIAHSLGSVPGFIIVKRIDTGGTNWNSYHTSLGNTQVLNLNTTAAAATVSTVWNNTTPTSTVFTVGSGVSVNASGATYVAYIFAHNAGGFGLTGTDNVISCGSFTTDGGGNATVNLGYEPQWVTVKRVDAAQDWFTTDSMRGMPWNNYPSGAVATSLSPNTSGAEGSVWVGPNSATGFKASISASATYIYIAIRRGPMKVPTDATKVFSPVLGNSSSTIPNFPSNIVTDLGWMKTKNNSSNIFAGSRLQGANTLFTNLTSAEAASVGMTWDSNSGWGSFGRDSNNIAWSFQRAPSFFDEVCYNGDGAIPRTITHNLTVAPELIITKARSSSSFDWLVGCNFGASTYQLAYLDATNAATTITYGNYTGPYTVQPSATSYGITGDNNGVNQSGTTYVAYLFASCPGVSKVTNFTGNGTTQTINCGFAGGARFVLLKATSTTGGWYVYDAARGMTTLTDPYLFLNSTAAESATLGSVTSVTGGFAVNESVLAGVNTNGVSYLAFAIA